MVPNKDLKHDVIQLEGEIENVKLCLDKILQVALKARGNIEVTQTLTVPQAPSQQKIRSVSRKTDTIVKKKKFEDSWQLVVSGSTQEQVRSAVALLQKPEEAGGDASPRRVQRGKRNNNNTYKPSSPKRSVASNKDGPTPSSA
jgi:hypothetical protein